MSEREHGQVKTSQVGQVILVGWAMLSNAGVTNTAPTLSNRQSVKGPHLLECCAAGDVVREGTW